MSPTTEDKTTKKIADKMAIPHQHKLVWQVLDRKPVKDTDRLSIHYVREWVMK
jgi:hypothetical protein